MSQLLCIGRLHLTNKRINTFVYLLHDLVGHMKWCINALDLLLSSAFHPHRLLCLFNRNTFDGLC